jgi:hypothetical protein
MELYSHYQYTNLKRDWEKKRRERTEKDEKLEEIKSERNT